MAEGTGRSEAIRSQVQLGNEGIDVGGDPSPVQKTGERLADELLSDRAEAFHRNALQGEAASEAEGRRKN
jgi:hypothetical protein